MSAASRLSLFVSLSLCVCFPSSLVFSSSSKPHSARDPRDCLERHNSLPCFSPPEALVGLLISLQALLRTGLTD